MAASKRALAVNGFLRMARSLGYSSLLFKDEFIFSTAWPNNLNVFFFLFKVSKSQAVILMQIQAKISLLGSSPYLQHYNSFILPWTIDF